MGEQSAGICFGLDGFPFPDLVGKSGGIPGPEQSPRKTHSNTGNAILRIISADELAAMLNRGRSTEDDIDPFIRVRLEELGM